MVRKKTARVAGSKTIRQGRPPWSPDLAQVEAAARRCGTMEQIAGELGIDSATLYRKKQASPEFDQALRRGREMRHWDKVMAQFEISDPPVPGKLNTPAAVVEYLKTRPAWLDRAQASSKAQAGSSPDQRATGPDLLRLTAEDWHEIEAIIHRAGQRIERPTVNATRPPVDQAAEIERFKMAAIRDPAQTRARAGNNNLLELCHDSKEEVTKGNGEGHVAMIEEGQSRRSSAEGAKPEFQGCPRCGRYLSARESAIVANGVLFSHEKCARPHAPIYR